MRPLFIALALASLAGPACAQWDYEENLPNCHWSHSCGYGPDGGGPYPRGRSLNQDPPPDYLSPGPRWGYDRPPRSRMTVPDNRLVGPPEYEYGSPRDMGPSPYTMQQPPRWYKDYQPPRGRMYGDQFHPQYERDWPYGGDWYRGGRP